MESEQIKNVMAKSKDSRSVLRRQEYLIYPKPHEDCSLINDINDQHKNIPKEKDARDNLT